MKPNTTSSAGCVITDGAGKTTEMETSCDGKARHDVSTVTVPFNQTFQPQQTCEEAVQDWQEGQENVHPGACQKSEVVVLV